MKIMQDLGNRTLLLLSLSVASNVFAADFVYKLKGYPVNTADCSAKAQELGGRFAAMTGLNVYASSCGEEYSNRYIYIRYSADAAIVPVSTSNPTYSLADLKGTYKTAAECQAALANEAKIFTEETGYDVFTSYCYSETYNRVAPWVAHVDGLGKTAPRKLVFSDKAMVLGRIVSPSSAEMSEIVRAAYERMGARLRSVILDPDSATGDMTVTFYYNSHPDHRHDVRLFSGSHGTYPSVEACQFEANQADALMGGAEVQLLKNVCADRYTSGVTELMTIHFMRSKMTSFDAGGQWATHQDCHNARNSVVERLLNAGRVNLAAVVCSYSDHAWHAVAIEKGVRKGESL